MKLNSIVANGAVQVDISKDLAHVHRYILSWFKENHKVIPEPMDSLIGYVFMSAWREGKVYLEGWRRDSYYRGQLRDFVWKFFYVHGWEYPTIEDIPIEAVPIVEEAVSDTLSDAKYGLEGFQKPDIENPYIGKFNGRYRSYMGLQSIDVRYKGNLKYLVSGDFESFRIEKCLIGRWLKQHGYEKEAV